MQTKPALNAATLKTLDRIRAACKRSGGSACLGRFDIIHVGRLERAGLVVTSIEGHAIGTPDAQWSVRPA